MVAVRTTPPRRLSPPHTYLCKFTCCIRKSIHEQWCDLRPSRRNLTRLLLAPVFALPPPDHAETMYTPEMLAAAFLGWVSAAFACTAFGEPLVPVRYSSRSCLPAVPSILMNFAARDCRFTGWFCISFTVGVPLNIGECKQVLLT